MTSYSNRPQYLIKKYGPLSFITFIIDFIHDWVNEDSIQYGYLIPVIISLLIYFFLTSKIIEVEISNESILIVNSQTVISWMDITYLEYKSILDVYEMDANGKTYFIAPYSISFTLFNKKLPDEFDRLINRKKKELSL